MRTFSSRSHVDPTHERHTGRVSIFLKVAVGLLLTLPLGAYVAGTLVASQASMPEERAPIGVESSPSSSTTATRPSPSVPTPDDRRPDDRNSSHGGSGDDDSDGSGHDDPDDVEVVRPSPHEIEDEREDRADEAADAREDAADEAEDAAEDAADDAEDAEKDAEEDAEKNARDSDDRSGDD